MKFNSIYIIVILLFLISGLKRPGYSANIIKVGTIEFRGLRNLSKYQVISNVKTKAVDGGILIDIDSLKRSLKKNKLISEYKIFEENKNLLISIVEKNIFMALVFKKGKQIIPFEVDKDFNILARGRIHITEPPLIVIGRKGLLDGRLTLDVKNFCLLVNSLKSKYPLLYSEFSEIYFISKSLVKIIFNNRKTGFILKPGGGNFMKLKYLVGYLDTLRYYPDEISIISDAAIISR